MKDDIPQNLPENGYNDSASGDSIEELVKFARQHFATDFPNPERIDCPPPETYSDLITDKQLPSEQLQTHLRSCSECFRFYRSLLDAQRKLIILKPDWATPTSWYKRVLSFGLVTGFLCVAFYGVYLVYQTKQQKIEQPSASRQWQEGAPAPQNNTTSWSANENDQTRTVERKKILPAPLTSPSRATIAAHTVAINFGRHSNSRSGSQSEIAPVMFVVGLNRVTVKLTPESPNGEYRLTLNDPFGQEVRPPVVGIFDGRTLHVELNLNSVIPGKYLICIVRAAEVPDCLPAQVNTK